jgi:three-Cys-motif partner protein
MARDGLRARENGDWATKKLSFLDHFVPPALEATQRKSHRVYVDLFAGPGMNISSDGKQFDGSALRILPMHAPHTERVHFTDAVFVNLSELDNAALAARVNQIVGRGDSLVPADHIEILKGDANRAIPGILERFHVKDYLLIFADIEAPRQWPWSSVAALKAQGHQSVDLYMLFPLEMGINRMLAYRRDERARYGGSLTCFFGSEEWREIVDRRMTESQASECKRELLDLYLRQLRTLWKHAGSVADVRLRGRQGLYRMLFATDHAAGARISEWARAETEGRTQLDMF